MDAHWIRQLAAVAALAPSADNSQPWTLRWNGTELTVAYARRDNANVFAADSHATLLSVGSLAEHLQAALAANALPAAWQWAPSPGLGQPYVGIVFKGTASKFIVPQEPSQRHTDRRAFRRDLLPAALLQAIGRYQENGNRALPLTDPAQKRALIRLVRLCSEARFCNQQLHESLIGSLRFTPEEVARGDGLDVRSLNLPPGGRQFLRFISDWRRLAILNRLGAYKLLALSEVALLAAAPALVCVVGGSGPRSAIDAGRLMTRIWFELNLQGIGVHPYYVVTDQINRLHGGGVPAGFESRIAAVDRELCRLLQLQRGEMLHMILRIGYPTAKPVRSRRLPPESVFFETHGRDSG